MTESKKKIERMVRINSEIPSSLDDALRVYAATKRVTRKTVIEQALRAYINPNSEDNRDAMIARRLQRVDQKLLTLMENERLLTEAVGAWVQVALGLMPEPLTDAERREFADKVKRRWPKFVELVADVMQDKARGLYSYLPKNMVATSEDFPTPPAVTQKNN